jgi:tight adherence protein C
MNLFLNILFYFLVLPIFCYPHLIFSQENETAAEVPNTEVKVDEVVESSVATTEVMSRGFPPTYNTRQGTINVSEHSNVIEGVKVFYEDLDGDLATSCEVFDVLPESIQFKDPSKTCTCSAKTSAQKHCLITPFNVGRKFSGEITFSVKFKDKDGWGRISDARIYVPVKNENGSTLIMLWGAVFLIGLATFIIARVIFTEEDQFQASEKLDEADAKKNNQDKDFILKICKPFFKRYFSPVVKGMKSMKSRRQKYRRKIAVAGLTNELTPDDFYAFKLFLIIGGPIVFLFVRWALSNDQSDGLSLSYIPLAAIGGYFFPDFWVQSKGKERQTKILLEMPFIVDMLALSVEAGLDTMQAVSRVVDKAPPGPLKSEFETLLKEIKIGASRSDALRNLAWRIDMIQVASFCATLIAADAVGAPLPPILKALSVEIRQKRSSEIEKKGAKAATKILIPMMMFILPAVLIIVGAPLVMELMFN